MGETSQPTQARHRQALDRKADGAGEERTITDQTTLVLSDKGGELVETAVCYSTAFGKALEYSGDAQDQNLG